MEWTDQAIILGARRHGENGVILEVMTQSHGRHLGLVRGGRSRRLLPVLQPGNAVALTWRARLESHLGLFTTELETARAAMLMDKKLSSYGLQFIAELTRLLPERDPYPHLFAAMQIILDSFDSAQIAGEMMVRYELALLAELGFGLDLERCAISGVENDLAYVSPKTGRAVNKEAGEPWRDKLLPLPPFLVGQSAANRLSFRELQDGFQLTAHFLAKYIYEPSGLEPPHIREQFINACRKDLAWDE